MQTNLRSEWWNIKCYRITNHLENLANDLNCSFKIQENCSLTVVHRPILWDAPCQHQDAHMNNISMTWVWRSSDEVVISGTLWSYIECPLRSRLVVKGTSPCLLILEKGWCNPKVTTMTNNLLPRECVCVCALAVASTVRKWPVRFFPLFVSGSLSSSAYIKFTSEGGGWFSGQRSQRDASAGPKPSYVWSPC